MSEYPGLRGGDIHHTGSFAAFQGTGVQDQVRTITDERVKVGDMMAAGLAGQVGTGAGDGCINSLAKGAGHRVLGKADPDFSGAGRDQRGDMGLGVEHQGEIARPEGVDKFPGPVRDLLNQVLEHGKLRDQYKNGVVAGAFLEVVYFFNSNRIKSICGDPVKALGREDHHALCMDDLPGHMNDAGLWREWFHSHKF